MTSDKGASAPGFQNLEDAAVALSLDHEKLLECATRAYAVGYWEEALILSESAGSLARIIVNLRNAAADERESGDG